MKDKKRMVLIVDDEAAILSLVKIFAEIFCQERELSDLEISTCESGDEALEILSNKDIQLIGLITDSRMPGMSGGELILEVKKYFPECGIALMSGDVKSGDLQKIAHMQEEVFFLEKPFKLDELNESFGHIVF